MFDRRLVRVINRGRCFAFIGSGPSCEAGYPSWHKLAESTYMQLLNGGILKDKAAYLKCLENKQYPELFRQAEADMGDRNKLVELVGSLLVCSPARSAFIYEILTKWPFACYLTTNFDDEIAKHLSAIGQHFTILRNRLEDFYPIRDGASHFIQKLHSDLSYPSEVVLTSIDYQRLYIAASGQYFRDKLKAIFQLFDVLIIGHSLEDPDINYVLRTAKEAASPGHPIYMVAADLTSIEERELLEKYNIVLLRYSNPDGSHFQLRKHLALIDRFISPRKGRTETGPLQGRSADEIKAAASMFIFTRLQSAKSSDCFIPLVLTALTNVTEPGIDLNTVLSKSPLNMITAGNSLREECKRALSLLEKQSLISQKEARFWITDPGAAKLREWGTIRETEKQQAYGQFLVHLNAGYLKITPAQKESCVKLAEEVVVATFANRGLTIANKIFSGQSAGSEELSDIFDYVARTAQSIEEMDLKAAFVEAIYRFVIDPTAPQKKYLASISQGFFLFHLLGLDPACSRLRRQVFEQTLWLCDSSILIPLLASGCYNHEYATELFAMLGRANAKIFTTSKLSQEAWEHFKWAIDFVKKSGIDTPDFLRAALVKGTFKQNLFIDGYIRLAADGNIGTFGDYIELVCDGKPDRKSFETASNNKGIELISSALLEKLDSKDLDELEKAKSAIKLERESRGTLRSNLQIESEAEVWLLVRNLRSGKCALSDVSPSLERVYFISHSRVLDSVEKGSPVISWTPEAVFRYLSALPEEQTNPDLLQQCMLQEYFYAGVSFIDRPKYLRFFGPSVDAARASYEREKLKYVQDVENKNVSVLDDEFDRTPDLEKPFFLAQMGWRSAEMAKQREEIASRRAKEAETKLERMEAEAKRATKKRGKKRQAQEAARQRHLKDQKHIRKRLRQAKKAKRKNR